MISSNNLAAELLARSRLRLAWSDADPESRGTVLDPAEMVGWRAARIEREHHLGEDRGVATCDWKDVTSVRFACVGSRRGFELGDRDALWAVQALLGVRQGLPPWATRTGSSLAFLLLDPERRCERHGDDGHRSAWVCRMWAEAEDGRAVDLSGVDCPFLERELVEAVAEMEAEQMVSGA